jgi:hypothetical protein
LPVECKVPAKISYGNKVAAAIPEAVAADRRKKFLLLKFIVMVFCSLKLKCLTYKKGNYSRAMRIN